MMKKSLVVFLIAIAGLAGAAAGVAVFTIWQFAGAPAASESRDVMYEVLPGRAFNSVAKDLELVGVVKSAEAFSLYARLTGHRGRLKAGEYQLSTGMRPLQVLEVITSGRSIARPFTISEGLNIYEIADFFEKGKFGTAAEFLRLARDPGLAKLLTGEDVTSLEGYLFPETYQVTKFMKARDVIATMVQHFHAVWKDVEPRLRTPGLRKHEVVTLASIIEKETGAPIERPLISSVFHNRMAKGMRLQTDPTIIYGIADMTGRIPLNISRADIMRPSRYNTYVIKGLPPGPIANPGREALIAAVEPASSPYLFFVSRNDGTHVFSTTYAEHDRAVKAFQLNPKARKGKSWRDLNSKGL